MLRRIKGQRYLEIGFTGDEYNFRRINCAHKQRLEVTCHDENSTGNDDTFFREQQEKFDLVFIDGIHTEDQVTKDIRNALSCLNTGGIIILHDCMPPDEWHQREYETYKEGESWNGSVWKAALRYFNSSVHKCILLDTDWGCGIIDTSYTQVPACDVLPGELQYKIHYPLLLQYKLSTGVFLQEYVKVFYHLACMGNWKEVFREQMQQLYQYGFQWVDITLLGGNPELEFVKSYTAQIRLKTTILFSRNDITQFEKPALTAIQEYAASCNGYVLYLHSKGVSNPGDETKRKWRELMMRELVQNSGHCKKELGSYDLIGVNWRDMPPVSHFCGNFWYASTNYLRRLPDFNYYYNNPRYRIWDQVNSKRLGCEFWIGSRYEKAKILSLVYRNEDFCNAEFWKNKQV